jgi:hypothetical protein
LATLACYLSAKACEVMLRLSLADPTSNAVSAANARSIDALSPRSSRFEDQKHERAESKDNERQRDSPDDAALQRLESAS